MVERFLGKKEVESSILSSGSDRINPNTMSQDQLIRMKCTKCKSANYFTTKNKKKVERKIELMKFCKKCKKRTPHKEGKLTG